MTLTNPNRPPLELDTPSHVIELAGDLTGAGAIRTLTSPRLPGPLRVREVTFYANIAETDDIQVMLFWSNFIPTLNVWPTLPTPVLPCYGDTNALAPFGLTWTAGFQTLHAEPWLLCLEAAVFLTLAVRNNEIATRMFKALIAIDYL